MRSEICNQLEATALEPGHPISFDEPLSKAVAIVPKGLCLSFGRHLISKNTNFLGVRNNILQLVVFCVIMSIVSHL